MSLPGSVLVVGMTELVLTTVLLCPSPVQRPDLLSQIPPSFSSDDADFVVLGEDRLDGEDSAELLAEKHERIRWSINVAGRLHSRMRTFGWILWICARVCRRELDGVPLAVDRDGHADDANVGLEIDWFRRTRRAISGIWNHIGGRKTSADG